MLAYYGTGLGIKKNINAQIVRIKGKLTKEESEFFRVHILFYLPTEKKQGTIEMFSAKAGKTVKASKVLRFFSSHDLDRFMRKRLENNHIKNKEMHRSIYDKLVKNKVIHKKESFSKGELEEIAFKEWWHNIGSGLRPKEHEDTETFVKRVCRKAWFMAVMINDDKSVPQYKKTKNTRLLDE